MFVDQNEMRAHLSGQRSPGIRYQLWDVARDAQAEWVKDSIASVNPVRRVVSTCQAGELRYDALVVAVGARQASDLGHALVFHDAEAGRLSEEVVDDLLARRARSAAFVVPEAPVYPCPATSSPS